MHTYEHMRIVYDRQTTKPIDPICGRVARVFATDSFVGSPRPCEVTVAQPDCDRVVRIVPTYMYILYTCG